MRKKPEKITPAQGKTRTSKTAKESLAAGKQNKAQKPLSENSVGCGERRHFTRRASDLDRTRNHLGELLHQQEDELKIKNGQIRHWTDKEKRAEEQVYIRTKAMDSTIDGIFIVDAQKDGFPIIYSNPSFQRMTGYSKKDIIGQNYFLFYGAEADPRIAEEIKNTLRQEKSFLGEMLNFRKNGEKFWNYLRIAPVRDAGGSVTHYVGIQTDVTLMREKVLEIDEQREELLHVTRVGKLAEFVSSLAHEISQPLTAILSYSQAAQRMLTGRDPELKKILSYIITDDQRAAEVIQRLRSLLKKSAPEMKPLDINALINDTIRLLATDATVRNNVLRVELASDLPLVRGDRIQLQQVILNLISNSFDALEGSQGVREIVVRTSHKDTGTITLEVEDSGCGIPEHNMPKLFTRFFTSKPDGLGMGLSISRSIIESHGGRLDVKNNPDRGVTFYFTIPVEKKDAE
ncbi:MAG: ATP-binding protein [Candidatus Omnitrophota bacterium]|jgi:PAS domain S-box-containing protein